MPKSLIDILLEEVHLAQARYEAARSLIEPTTNLHPSACDAEHLQRLAAACRARTSAMNAYTHALRRFSEFLTNGTVPDDLRQPVRASSIH